MEREAVFERVRAIIANVIELDNDEINSDSSLIDDLGMESVDLVNINAKIEQEFNIEIAQGDLWNFGKIFEDKGMMKQGKITDRGVKYLRETFPGDDFEEVKPGTAVAEILGLIKVKFIVNYLLTRESLATH